MLEWSKFKKTPVLFYAEIYAFQTKNPGKGFVRENLSPAHTFCIPSSPHLPHVT